MAAAGAVSSEDVATRLLRRHENGIARAVSRAVRLELVKHAISCLLTHQAMSCIHKTRRTWNASLSLSLSLPTKQVAVLWYHISVYLACHVSPCTYRFFFVPLASLSPCRVIVIPPPPPIAASPLLCSLLLPWSSSSWSSLPWPILSWYIVFRINQCNCVNYVQLLI